MKTKKITQTVKAVLFVCLFFPLTHLTAQNTGDYKYKVFDPFYEFLDNVEINNQHYILTRTYSENFIHAPFITFTTSVIVFDENLNKIKEFPLSPINYVYKLLYAENNFYIISSLFDTISMSPKPMDTISFAKYDTNFELVQPIVYYTFEEYPEATEGGVSQVFMTKNNEFIVEVILYDNENHYDKYFWHLDNNGTPLQKIAAPHFYFGINPVETDNYYFFYQAFSSSIVKINKNDLEDVNIMENPEILRGRGSRIEMDGSAVGVGNTFIRSQDYPIKDKKCDYENNMYRGIAFYDEDLNLKDSLVFGLDCEINAGIYYGMSYVNPDSIYYVYYNDVAIINKEEQRIETKTTISIANFSHNGQLNFNTHLDIANDPLQEKSIERATALSNGGVLIYGYTEAGSYLLLYHPTKNLSVQETVVAKREIYPNPVQSQFTVTNTENADIQLFNILGQKVFQTFGTQENTVVNTASLPQGLYVLKVVKDNVSTVHKVQIMK